MSTFDEQKPQSEQDMAAEEHIPVVGDQRPVSHSPGRTEPMTSQPATSSFLELLAALSHEFHTPLTVIRGYTSTLLRQKKHLTPEEQEEFLQMILQAGRRLELLTERLFEIAQFEAGAIQLHPEPVDIPTLARETMNQVADQIPELIRDRFVFALHCRDTVGNQVQNFPPVNGDVQRLRQVLEHLLENAICYSPTGGRIDVIVQPAAQAGSIDGSGQSYITLPFVEICVCDFGVGVPEEHLERIFDPFYRVESDLTRENNGLGLGLAACRHLVALHQGRIWAESCAAGGSAFHVWLPLDKPATVC